MEQSGFNWGLPENINIYGAKIDALNSTIHWFMLGLFVFWGAFFAYALIRFRARPGHTATYQPIHATWSKWLEIGVAVFEAVLLIGFSMPVWYMFKKEFPKPEASTTVRIVAQQFAWNFHYAGYDGVFGKAGPDMITASNPIGLDPNDPHGKDDIVTVNTMRFPVEKPVIARISSKDVIHSFGVPALRIKQDAVPGMEIPIWFQASKTGDYEMACSQLCGNSHYRMKAIIKPQTQAEFDAWYAENTPEEARKPAPAEGQPADGEGAPEDAGEKAGEKADAGAATPATAAHTDSHSHDSSEHGGSH